MTRRTFLAAPALAARDSRPNLLLLMTDQQWAGAMSCAGNRYLRTPAMDSLAADGVRFDNAYCAYPVCSPSRGSIFTGRTPHETGVRVNGRAIAPGMATMGEWFARNGYRTVYGGKWHLPKSFDGMTGFEKLIGGSGQGRDMDAPLAETCAAWLRGAPPEPFLMVASFMNPHDICDWIRRHPGRHDYPNVDRFPPAPRNLAVDPHEPEPMRYHRTAGYDLMSKGVGIASEWRRDDFRHYLHSYYRMVEDVDRQIGRVLDALRETGLDRNTVVAFCSDHGEGMGGHRWVQKAAFYDESVRVPLILSGPGVGRRVERNLASLMDIFPTFCDYAGVPVPEDVRGLSLRQAPSRTHVISELLYGDSSREGRMLATRRFKYVVFNSGDASERLFDLEADPGETQNLARLPDHASALDEHRRMLREWISRTGDDFQPAR